MKYLLTKNLSCGFSSLRQTKASKHSINKMGKGIWFLYFTLYLSIAGKNLFNYYETIQKPVMVIFL